MTVAVNVSSRQLSHDPHLGDAVNEAIDGSGIAARQLCLELTETAAHEPSHTSLSSLSSLAALSAADVRIALDDYGTGYSRLAQLRDIPVSTLKIVETPHQRDRLRELGCDFGQGYVFSPPLEPVGFARLLDAGTVIDI